MEKIFVTGGTGLLGRAVLNQIAETFQVLALKRKSSITQGLPNSIQWIEGDLKDFATFAEQLVDVSTIIHLAAKVNFNPRHGKRVIDFNVVTTKEIVNYCLERKIRLIYISSVAALGSINDRTIDEKTPYDLDAINTDYALSKYLSEIEVWRGISEGLDAVILNPSIILGIPSQFPESSGVFWKQIDNGLPFYPLGTTGFVDARDVAEIIVRLLQTNITAQSFIVNAENRSYKSFFQSIAENINKKPPQKPLTNWLSSLFWRLSSLMRLLGLNASYTKAIHQISQKSFEYDNSKVRNEFDFEFRPVSDSIKWVSEAYLLSRET